MSRHRSDDSFPVLLGGFSLAALILTVWSLAAIAQFGCSGASSRETTLRASVIATNSARDAFHRWDVERQQQIVKESPTRADYEKKIAEHRQRRDAVLLVFGGIYERIAKASVTKGERELDDAVQAADKLAEAMKDLTPTTEGPKPEDLPPPINPKVEPCANGSTEPCPSLPPIVPADAGVTP